MNSESVDLIATDPPFNKGKDFHATPDSLAAGAKFQDRWSWERDVQQDWVDQITDDHPRLMEAIESARYAHTDGMGAFMCFMAVRLLEMRRVLKPTGCIYLHCDPTASHYLKAVMDAIFGWRNFQNEVIWCYREAINSSKRWNRKHDVILFYSKGKTWTFNADTVLQPHSESTIKKYRHEDEKGKYRLMGRGLKDSPIKSKRDVAPSWEETHPELVYRHYLRKGTYPVDYWMIDIINQAAKERMGYPKQKPLELYERILKASSNEGDIVLDPFAGCATTLVAAEHLQREWVGMDIWEGAHRLVDERLSDTTGLFGKVTFTNKLPERTDDGVEAAPFLRVKQRVKEPEGRKWTRAQMYEHLLDQNGPRCEGCDRTFDDSRYLELDHNVPRSDGGINHVSNRILLCSPCNRLKSNVYTLSGLRRENGKRGYMR